MVVRLMTKDDVVKFVNDMMSDYSKKKRCVTIIDPPSGWRYGFPKPYVDENGNKPSDMKQWLLDSGYPKFEIDSCGKHFHVRFWETKET